MDVEFRDKTLALIETDRAAETRLPISVINSLRQKLVVIRAAPDERTLRNWKSLHYEKMGGDERSIRINTGASAIWLSFSAVQNRRSTLF